MTTNIAGSSGAFLLDGVVPVNRLGFGALRLTDWEPRADDGPQIAVARRAIELGVTFLDTADSYDLGANEELLAAALAPYPDDLVIATKAGRTRPSEDDWTPLGRPEYLKQQALLSLRRLRLERLALFQLHRVDPTVPFEDQIGALAELLEAGTVARVGLSEVSVEQIERARAIVPITSVQNHYNVYERWHEPVLEYCEREGIAFIPFLPLADGRRPAGVVEDVAGELGATPMQVALAWLLARSPVTIPIPGTSSIGHLEQNVEAARLELSPDQYARLSALAEPPVDPLAGSRGAG